MFNPRRASVYGCFLQTVERYNLFPSESKVLVAVSGGSDSVCLLDLLRIFASERKLRLIGFHLNHRLRETARRDEAFVRSLFGSEPLVVVRSDVGRYAQRHRLGIEEAARLVRYRHMERVAKRLGCVRVALGHNADDNLETMLFNLARGAGLSGLAGIPVQRGIFVRPLLDLEREDIVRYLRARGLDWVEDETNKDIAFRRNLLRLQVVPALKAVNPGVVANARRTSILLRDEDDFLDTLAREALNRVAKVGRNRVSVDCCIFGEYNRCLKRRIVRILIPGLDAEAVERVLAFLEPDCECSSTVVKGIRLSRRGKNVLLNNYYA